MHAVFKIGSHQYDAEPGKVVTLEHLEASVGSEVRFTEVLYYSDGKAVKLGAQAKGAAVVGKVTEQVKGKKIIVFKKKRRKGYTRKLGHRQLYTKVEITGIEA